LKGHRFSGTANIQGHATTILQSIPEEEFRNILTRGNTDSLSVLVCKETTSKVTATIRVQVIKYSFYRGIPGTSLSQFVITTDGVVLYK
jgi:hypothetical protein